MEQLLGQNDAADWLDEWQTEVHTRFQLGYLVTNSSKASQLFAIGSKSSLGCVHMVSPPLLGGSRELVGCNFFKWCIDEGNGLKVEERTGSVRNEEVGVWSMEDSVLQMEETYGEKIRLGFIEKSLVKLDKWLKLLVGMIFFIFVLNVIVLAMLVKVG
ncbi:hypothetical protein LR48_Vigan07g144500 [Vigna angularis]|uniref:Uncharacterized protein n=1 Tax=Phaseolus angularis TaxID=3914 RepID=A0A0L9UYG7_PHAAN|nr:hypothetical protein LR48_Vigan07g144500 [Vigna angularis]